MSDLEDIIEAYGEKFDALREVYLPEGATLEFLKQDTLSKEFDLLGTIESGWFLKESNRYRNHPSFDSGSPVYKISVAKNIDDPEFIQTINQADYARVVNEIYKLRPNLTRKPDLDEASWRFYGERHLSRSQF